MTKYKTVPIAPSTTMPTPMSQGIFFLSLYQAVFLVVVFTNWPKTTCAGTTWRPGAKAWRAGVALPGGLAAGAGSVDTLIRTRTNDDARTRGHTFATRAILIADFLLPILFKVHVASNLAALVRLETALFQEFDDSRRL